MIDLERIRKHLRDYESILRYRLTVYGENARDDDKENHASLKQIIEDIHMETERANDDT